MLICTEDGFSNGCVCNVHGDMKQNWVSNFIGTQRVGLVTLIFGEIITRSRSKRQTLIRALSLLVMEITWSKSTVHWSVRWSAFPTDRLTARFSLGLALMLEFRSQRKRYRPPHVYNENTFYRLVYFRDKTFCAIICSYAMLLKCFNNNATFESSGLIAEK